MRSRGVHWTPGGWLEFRGSVPGIYKKTEAIENRKR